MNMFSKSGTKKLSKRVLAVMLAVALIATQFLTTAVWTFADTPGAAPVTSPAGTAYNVVLDADDLDADDSFDPATAVSKVTANALSGNAYAWNMTAANYLVAKFPATGYSDEVALVMWVDTTAQSEDVNVLIDMGDGTNTYTVAGDADDNGLIYTFPVADPEGGMGIPAVSDDGVITLPAGLVGWLMIPFEAFNAAVPSGAITSIGFTTGASGAIYLDDIGFASGDWSENFFSNLLEGTLTANRRARCDVYACVYADATCTAPKTCVYCGGTEGLANGHTWDIDDCAQDRTCIICSAPEAAKNHSYVSDGDCFTADNCGSCSAVQPSSELGHHYADATCTEPKTCEGCGATEGSALGHDWYMGVCNTCDAVVYTVAEDFEEASVTGPEGYWSLVADKTPFGQALEIGRETSKTEFGVALDKAGTADDEAIVFYYDNTGSGNSGEAYFSFIPYTTGGCGITLGTSYTYYAVIDGEVVTLNPSSNFSLKLPKQTKGWVVLPLPASGTWSYGGGDKKYYGTTKEIGRIYLAFPEFHNASVVIDQLGFTADVAQFEAFAAAGNVNLNGCTDYELCEGDNHAWKDATCNLPKICSICGLAQGLPTGIHNYKDATCSSPKTCLVCGATEGTANEALHVWKNANCGYPKTCETCGKTEGETVGEHDWDEATCVAPKTCANCGMTEGAALGHSWGADNLCQVCGSPRPLYDIALDFEGASSDDYVNGTVLSCGSIYGSSLQITHNASLGGGTGSINFQHIMFDKVGTANHEALVFFYDNTGSSTAAKLAFAPLSADGYGTTVKGGHPVTTIINGVLTVDNTAIVTENFTMTLPANSSGWVMLSLGRNGTSNWGLWGGNAPKTTEGIAGIAVRANSGTTVILDQFGFVESMDTFAEKAVTGNDAIDGYTGVAHDWIPANCGYAKHCSGCGKTEGDRVGTHNWAAGTCTVCGRSVYTIAEDFEDAAITGSEGAWELVTDKTPFGQAMKYTRLGDGCLIKVAFDEIGTGEYNGIVFYFDNTESGFDGEASFRIRPYTTSGRFATLGKGYTYYTVINGVATEAQVADNMNLKLPAKSSGWVILPLPQMDVTWPGDGDGTWDESVNEIAGFDFTYVYYADASIILDQFGYTEDAETFKAAALAGNSNIPGYVSSYCEQNGHSWTEATCGVGSVCSVCNTPNPDKPATGDHKWEDPTCGADGYCKVCLIVNPDKLATGDHKWKDATCGVDGYCEVCGAKNEADLATGNHNLVEETCGAPEYCTVCQQTFTPATGAHDWTKQTCTSPKTCKICKQVEGSAPGHVWGDDKICDVCGEEKSVYSIAQGFESETANVSNVVDGTILELVTGKTDFGQALKFGRTTTPGGLRINFDVMGQATDKALVFWYDVTGSGFNGDASMHFIPRDNNGWGTTLSTNYTYYTVINGKVASHSPSSNFNLKFTKGTKGWVIIPLNSDVTDTWGCGGGTQGTTYMGNTCENLAAVDVLFQYFNDASVVLDQFGFVEDIQAFTDCAIYGNLNMNGYTGEPSACTEHTWTVANCGQPKHCTECGLVDGVRTGEHDWNEADCENAKNCSICFAVEGDALGHDFVDGFCSRCELEEGDYQVVLDFDGRKPTNVTNPACTYVLPGIGYKGNGMILDRGSSAGLNSSQVRFNPTGNAEDEALVFFMDASHNTAIGNITLYVYDNGTTRCLKPTAGSTIYAIDVQGKKTELTIPDNNGVPFEIGFEGWYVIPFSAITTNHWGSGTLELTPGTVNELFLGYGGVAGSLFELDNIGFTTDTEAFIAEAMAGTVNSDVSGEAEKESNIGKPLPGMGGDDEYVPDLSNPSPSDYNIIVDYDDKMYVSLVDHETQEGNAGYSKVVSENLGKPHYAGQSLMWDRGGDGTVTRIEMGLEPTGYSDENAFVFWINTDDMLSNGHGITLFLYGENALDGSEVCMKLGNGKVYRTVDTRRGKVKDRICTQDGSVYVDSKFEGFVIIPFSAMINHWGGMGVQLKPGSVNKMWMYHGYTYNEVLYLDNMGFTHNIDNFTEQAIAGTLNDSNDRVDVGRPSLPMPEGAGVSDTNLSGGADGKTADNEFFHTVVNFNSKVPTALTSSNAYVKLVKEGASGYGSALNWFKNDDEFATEITLSTEGGLKTDEGIALWISTKDSGNTFDTKIRYMPHDFVMQADGTMKERCWRLIDNATYYLVQDGIASSQIVKTSQNVSIPGGFEGWLIVPYESLEIHWGTPEGQKAEDQVVDPTQMKKLNLYYGNSAVTEYIQIDEYGFYSDARAFIESLGAVFPKAPLTGVVLQGLDRTFGEGGIGNSAATGSLVWSDKATLEFNGDVSNDSYSVMIGAAAGNSVHFPLDVAADEDDPYGVQAEDIPALQKFTGLGFWINNGDQAAKLTISVAMTNGKTVALKGGNKTTDIYRLVDENSALTKAYLFGGDNTITVPANFTGWVVVDTAMFESGCDLSLLKEVILTFKNDANVVVDTVRAGTSAVSLITKEMNYPMDTDLLVSLDETKATIGYDADGFGIITLYGDMTSHEFYNIVELRGGYRAIFRDSKGAQLFGSIDLMGKAAVMKIYLGATLVAEYAVDTVGGSYEDIQKGYDIDGDGIIDGPGVDIDGDGKFDGIGVDWDGDGEFDAVVMDTDGDGIVDGLDTNFDGIVDVLDLNGDWRGDGIDLDGDGVVDGLGIDVDFDGLWDGAIEGIDVDGDGIWDGVDIDWDGVVDYYDMEGDGVCDGIGIDMGGDSEVDFVISGVDFDGDGLFDGVDIDGDGYSDGIALDLDGDGYYDGVGVDLTGDGYVDAMAIDLDNDGLFDGVDLNFDAVIDFKVIDGDLGNIPGLQFPDKDGNFSSPDTGDTNILWVYILGAAMLALLAALAVYNRKVTNK